LIALGLPAGQAPEAWVLEHPDRIEHVHREYVEAGADAISACTFGGNRPRLDKCGLADHAEQINRKAVELAKRCAGHDVYVFGDLGPTGEFFQPHGTLTEEKAREVYEEQISILAETGVDFFLLETYYDLKETLICLEVCRKITPDIPVGVSLTFNDTPRGFFTVMGDPALESLKAAAEQGAFLVGSNCTLEAEGMLKLAKHISTEIETPLIFQANAGNPEITPEGIVYPQGPQEFSEFAGKMLALGVNVIGGCCGSEPDHIRAMRQLIDENAN
jgi:methionine synthase I (cobalamin-dependent)